MNSRKVTPIGGFFELEPSGGTSYYTELLPLNLGRSCLEYLLRASKFEKIYMPFFNCDVLFNTLNRLPIEVEYYSINENLEPAFNLESIEENAGFLYTNYFGLKDDYINKLALNTENLIIDNCQAFFSQPKANVDTFYSPRKFFGVPDGAYLSTTKRVPNVLEEDKSDDRLVHLLGRKNHGPQAAYGDFLKHELRMNEEPLKHMSKFTANMLSSIEYEKAKFVRNKNYTFLHEALGNRNLLKVEFDTSLAPLAYPFIIEKEGLREALIDNQIFVPRYWPNVLENMNEDSMEYYFAKNVLPLPIDHRFDLNDMKRIVQTINSYPNV